MAGDSATFVTDAPTCGKEAFLSSKFGTSLNSNYGMINNYFSAIPYSGTEIVYSSPFQLNKDFPVVEIRLYNLSSLAYETTITLEYTFDFLTWTAVGTSIYQRILVVTGTNDVKDYILTMILPGVAYRFKYDTGGSSPLLGGTVYFEVKQLAGMTQ